MAWLKGIGRLARFIKARMGEKSTWAALGMGVTGAAALVSPWSYAFIACGVIGALVPTSNEEKAVPSDGEQQ